MDQPLSLGHLVQKQRLNANDFPLYQNHIQKKVNVAFKAWLNSFVTLSHDHTYKMASEHTRGAQLFLLSAVKQNIGRTPSGNAMNANNNVSAI